MTKNVPPYAIVVGNPGQIIGYRFDADTIEKLEQIQWWNQSDDWFKEHITHFISPERLLNNL